MMSNEEIDIKNIKRISKIWKGVGDVEKTDACFRVDLDGNYRYICFYIYHKKKETKVKFSDILNATYIDGSIVRLVALTLEAITYKE